MFVVKKQCYYFNYLNKRENRNEDIIKANEKMHIIKDVFCFVVISTKLAYLQSERLT